MKKTCTTCKWVPEDGPFIFHCKVKGICYEGELWERNPNIKTFREKIKLFLKKVSSYAKFQKQNQKHLKRS